MANRTINVIAYFVVTQFWYVHCRAALFNRCARCTILGCTTKTKGSQRCITNVSQ